MIYASRRPEKGERKGTKSSRNWRRKSHFPTEKAKAKAKTKKKED